MANSKCDPYKLAQLATLAPKAKSVASIARRMGITAMTVVVWAEREGIVLPKQRPPTKVPDEPWVLDKVEMPPWVPEHLQDEFWRVAEADGEHAACAKVRKIKAAERAFTTGVTKGGGTGVLTFEW